MKSRLLLRGSPPSRIEGNVLLSRMVGAEIRFLTPAEYEERDRLFAEECALLRSRGLIPHVIPEGGSNALGSLGYVRAMEEIHEQCLESGEHYDVIITAVGSGGTLAGLAAGHALHPQTTPRPIGINVCNSAEHFQGILGDILESMHARYGTPAMAGTSVEILDGHVGQGYALSTPAELDTLRRFAQQTGIFLDPVYSGKAMHGLIAEIQGDPERWRGQRVLFLHTGGIFGLFPRGGSLDTPLVSD
jgi:D-cysteine desulfhydrase